MQIKKDEVRLAILKEAEKEFMQKGFAEASVRKVVKAAGTTIGNFYNYFESKERLFDELVKDEYQSFIYLMNHHDTAESEGFNWEKVNVEELRGVLALLIHKVMPLFSDRFLLLVEGSKGTKYENAREKLLGVLDEHFTQHLMEFGYCKVDKAMGSIISEQVLYGVILILKQHKDEKVRRELLTEHLIYHIIGVMGLLGLLRGENYDKSK